MRRSDIRYALFRCKAGTPDEKHLAIFDKIKPQLEDDGFGIEDFTTEWDVSLEDAYQVVTGKIVKKLNKDKPLFDGAGKLKE
jgi:hypothetical protein